MSLLLDLVNFGPDDVRAAMAPGSGEAMPRCVRMAVLTSQTCGEPCWHAREEICRCSCGGKNHGCLNAADGERPVRMAKIDGERYTLAAVGRSADLIEQAKEINGRQWRQVERAEGVIGSRVSGDDGKPFSADELAAARAAGENVWFTQYCYSWRETDAGAPARMKTATREQVLKWPELAGWQDSGRDGVYLLWQIETMPAKPEIMRVDRKTGLPLVNQSPNGEQV